MNTQHHSIAIIGLGNVGVHLLKAFAQSSITVSEIYNRDESVTYALATEFGVKPITQLNEITADLCIICVADTAINEVIQQLPFNSKIAYTSGSIELSSLERKEHIGVFYPLQTFSKNVALDYTHIPFFIESNDTAFSQELFALAQKISLAVYFANSQKRKQMHLAAVFVNNFINHQIYIAEQLAKEFDFNVQVLYPLLNETIHKAITNGAFSSQTGPAKRADFSIVEAHQALLQNEDFKNIYQSLTQSIIHTYHDKL